MLFSQSSLNSSSNSENDFNSKSTKDKELDTVSESGFKLSDYKFKFAAFRNRKKGRSNSININPLTLNNDVLQIAGVMFFLSDSNGICGDLSLDQKRILFASGMIESTDREKKLKNASTEPKSPFKEENNVNYYEIDFLNVGDIYKEISNDYYNLIIHCRNFKHVKITLKQTSDADVFISRLNNVDFENSTQRTFHKVCLWEYLFNNYQYKVMSDWTNYEKWYVANYKIHFSHFNEHGQCESLPSTIIVPRDIRDNQLEMFSYSSNGNRVPVVTFLYKKSSHLMIRSTSFNNNTLQGLMAKAITPLRELDIDSILPSINEVEKCFIRLRKSCFTVGKLSNKNHIQSFYDVDYSKQFWSKCSIWLNIISKTLKLANQLIHIISYEASIGLVETFDSNWNCVLSSLVQIVLDPNRRTIQGFESLISKEWIYLSGYKSVIHNERSSFKLKHSSNITLFILFIDCIHQILVQNPKAFEFSTMYLILLVDNLFITEKYTREKSTQFEQNKQHFMILNPNYTNNVTISPISSHIVHMKLFYQLYLRNVKSDIHKYTPEEYLFYKKLEQFI